MARYPGAQYRPLGSQSEPRMSRHDIFCVHTMVGYLWGTDAYFRGRGYYGTESHWGIGGEADGDDDGTVLQWQDTVYAADANLDGKDEVLSVETSDGGDPNQPWSEKQIKALVKLGIWVCKKYDIPPVLIPDTQPGRRGIGYHRMGCDHSSSYRPRGWPYDKWRERGGVKWSGVLGKTCPGDVRIKQLVDIVIPRIKAGVEEGDMPSVKEISYGVHHTEFANPSNAPKSWRRKVAFREWVRYRLARKDDTDRIEAKLDRLITAMRDHDTSLGERIDAALADAAVRVDVHVPAADDGEDDEEEQT